MKDAFEFTLNSPLTEEQWDMIEDVDFEKTDHIWFHTKHGKEVEFAKVRHGRWIFGSTLGHSWMKCSECCKSQDGQTLCFTYCPNCGAKMDAESKEE